MPIIKIHSKKEVDYPKLYSSLLEILQCNEVYFKLIISNDEVIQRNKDTVIHVTWMPRDIEKRKEITKLYINYYNDIFVYFQELSDNSVFTKERI